MVKTGKRRRPSSRTLLALVNDLLNVAKAESGRLRIDPTAVALQGPAGFRDPQRLPGDVMTEPPALLLLVAVMYVRPRGLLGRR